MMKNKGGYTRQDLLAHRWRSRSTPSRSGQAMSRPSHAVETTYIASSTTLMPGRDYDVVVTQNGVVISLPATPTADQQIGLASGAAVTFTVLGNGADIDGAPDLTIGPFGHADLRWLANEVIWKSI